MSAGSQRPLPLVAGRNVSKTFRIPEHRVHTLKERVLHPRRRISHQSFRALNDVSFAVAPGEFFGMAGRNGSGKSTLLKCVAGIYRCEGDIWVRGRLSTFIELGVGFNPDLPARDNVITNGIMMGLSPREARRRYDAVIEFAELQEFQELKLKNYSSGMHVRLAFSVAIQVDADILLIDEVLAVGDASFQQKCYDAFDAMRRAGKTIVLVTHDMAALQRFCDRALLLERGQVVHVGTAKEVADRYIELNFGRDPTVLDAAGAHGGGGEARVGEVWIEDASGRRVSAVPQGERVTARVLVDFHVDVEDPQASLALHNEEGTPVFVTGTWMVHEETGNFRAGERAVFSFTFDNVLAPGRYSPIVNLSRWGSALNVIDRYEWAFSFLVTATAPRGGLVDLPTDVAVERLEAGAARADAEGMREAKA